MIQKNIIVCFLFVLCQPAYSQFKLTPNQNQYATPSLPTNRGDKTPCLNLPFFDDFSNYTGRPNKDLWIVPSGVWVNHSFGKNPISMGVVTFDGLKADGSPYSFSNEVVEAIGVCDTLTSRCINLSMLLPADSVHLSFFWQEEGFGERPDETDSLYVEFLDKANKWKYVWGKTGGLPTAPFKLAVIPVMDTMYLHDKFQFRIASYGRKSGMYDAWHIDYVYMNKDRKHPLKDTTVEDVAASKMRNFFFKNYTAMPLKQYFANPTAETSDSLKATINNLSSGFDVISYKMVLEDTITKTVLTDLGTTTSFVLGGNKRQFPVGRLIPASPFTNNNQKKAIRSKLIVNTGDITLALRRNDTLSQVNMLSDYLAYDDGSAEYGAGVNQRFGKVAIKFTLNEPDTLTDIRFHLTKFEKDLVGQTFNLVIWQQLAIFPVLRDSVKYKLVVPIRYPTKRDTLLSVEAVRKQVEAGFKFPLIPLPAGEFYIGWEQTNNDRVTMGYDRNTNSTAQILFNVGNQWGGFDPQPDETGSLLFRPVFAKDYLLSREMEKSKVPFSIFPNPAQDYVNLQGSLPTQVDILDLQGRIRTTHHLGRQEGVWQISTEGLATGFYLLRGTMKNGKSFIQKLIIQK